MKTLTILATVFATLFFLSCSKEKSEVNPDLTKQLVGIYQDSIRLDGSRTDHYWKITKSTDSSVNIIATKVMQHYPGKPLNYSNTIYDVKIANSQKLDFRFTTQYSVSYDIEILGTLDNGYLAILKTYLPSNGGISTEKFKLKKQ